MAGVIFDFNGTLFIDHDKHVLAWNRISEQIRGKDITQDELLNRFNGVPNAVIINGLMEGKATAEDIKHYSLLKEQYYREYCQKDQEHFHLIEGAEDYFKMLNREHIPFTIASASIYPNIEFFIRSFHLDDFMDVTQIVYDDGTYENKVAMFKQAAKNIQVPIDACIIYEDSLSGIRSAYTAGCHDIRVIDSTHQGQVYASQPGVTKIIRNFREVL